MTKTLTVFSSLVFCAAPVIAQTTLVKPAQSDAGWQVVSQAPIGSQTQVRPVLTTEQVLAMVRARRGTVAIIAKIQESRVSFGAFSDKELRAKGVPQVVIFEMREAAVLDHLSGTASDSETAEALTNKDILLMLNAGLPQAVAVAKIRNSKCNFDTSVDALTALKVKEVPDAILLAMMDAQKAPAPAQAISVPTASSSMNDLEYLRTFLACDDFIKRNGDFMTAGLAYYRSHDSKDRDTYIGWFDANRDELLSAKKSCESDPLVQKDQRASDAATALPEISLAYFVSALLNQQNDYYADLVNKYNQLVLRYNANVSYTRSVAYQLSIAQYFTNMFRQPVARSLDCHTSEDNGFGTTTSCTEY